MSNIPSSNVSFSSIRDAYNNEFDPDLSNPISLSQFRGKGFTDNSTVPAGSDDAISINTDFKGKTFKAD